MSFLLNQEKSAYRTWVNAITSAVLPGAGQLLSGRIWAAAFWFLINFGLGAVAVALFVSPYIKSLLPFAAVFLLRLVFWAANVVDGCEKPIPLMNLKAWLGFWILVVAMMTLPFWAVRQFLFRPFYIPTAGMAPTLLGGRKNSDGRFIRGDRIIVSRWIYYFNTPERGDVVAFGTEAISRQERERFAVLPGDIYVKRVVGLPGERVSIRPPDIYINGQKLAVPKFFETFLGRTNETATSADTAENASRTDEVQLGFDEYYVVGDNIANSLDSRFYGPIKGGHFVGKAGWIYWPMERRGIVQ